MVRKHRDCRKTNADNPPANPRKSVNGTARGVNLVFRQRLRARTLVLCALFAALSAVLSQISVPIGLVPVTLTHVSIILAGGLLGPKYGLLSQLAFVLLGLAGAPVFAGFSGGIGVLVGPTGGFIVGYLLCALVTGLIVSRFGRSVKALAAAIALGWAATYIPGLAWLLLTTNLTLSAAVSAYMLPFLPGDLIKSLLAAYLIRRLRSIEFS